MTSSIHFAILSLVLICHLKYTNAQFRIRGGGDINIEQTAHTVAFFYQIEDEIDYVCTGSLVNENSVVTVAHRLEDLYKTKLFVRAGITHISEEKTGCGQKSKIRRIHYCGFNPVTGHMDVAVVKLSEPFHQTRTVKSIPLCESTLEQGLDLEISGWGSISSESTKPSDHLKTTKVPIMARTECEYIYASEYRRPFLAETFMCGESTGSDPCHGDAGAGGLVHGKLCAVVTSGCERDDSPNLFTNITNPTVYDFISSKILSN